MFPIVYVSYRVLFDLVLITGCSPNGLGASAAGSIAAHNPNLLVLAGRSRSKIELTQAALKARFPAVNSTVLELDLASFASVRKAADELNTYSERLDVLINNAAIMATPFTKTADRFESNFGTNHLGPFLFTNLILERMLQDGRTPRIVNVTSSAYRLGAIRYDDVNFEVLLSHISAGVIGYTQLILTIERRMGNVEGLRCIQVCEYSIFCRSGSSLRG
jgi:NAD(P)-dependent dehydrogenase (short-subunit alcohol dehydrogenase family)